MFPGGMNPAAMKRMMKQLGIKSEDLGAKRVIFELRDGGRLVIENAQVTVMEVGGQRTYTVVGEEREETGSGAGGEEDELDGGGEAQGAIPEEDVELVMEQTRATREEARAALEEARGDLAEAISRLKKTD